MKKVFTCSLMVAMLVSACGGLGGMGAGAPASGAQETAMLPAEASASPAPELLIHRYTTPTASATPLPTRTPTGTATASVTSTPTLIRTPTPTYTATPVFEPCSPLVYVPRKDLAKAISDAYTAPPPRSDARHEGVDFAYFRWRGVEGPIEGSTVQSVLPGVVSAALTGTFPYGNFIIIETPYVLLPPELVADLKLAPDVSLYLLYAHLQDDLLVQLGDLVGLCQPIGYVGKSGNTDAAHLHLETRRGPPGAAFGSMSAFTDTATEEEKKNYRLWRVSGNYLHFDPMLLLSYPWGLPPTPFP